MDLPDLGLKVTSDVVFQYVFSSPGSEPGLLGLINAVQTDANRPPAKEILVRNPFNPRHSLDDKGSILDIKATDSLNRTYDIEMQSANKDAFVPRVLYYWSGVYRDQIKAGESYTMLYPVVSMILTEFEMFRELEDLHNVFNLVPEKNPNFCLTDHIQIHTLEFAGEKLRRFLRTACPLRNWVDFLINGNARTEEEMKTLTQSVPGLEVAYTKLREFNRSDELRELALARQKAERDKVAEISFARNEGIEIGMEKGIGIGIEKGVVKTSRSKLLQAMKIKFPQQFTPDMEAAISQITDARRLDILFTEALMAGDIQDIAKLL